MPEIKFNTIEQAYQSLTDAEILDDSKEVYCAEIAKVKGLHKIKISMVSEYDFYYTLSPMRDEFFNYYLNKFQDTKNIESVQDITDRLKAIINDLNDLKSKSDAENKVKEVMTLFEDKDLRHKVFIYLKKLNIIKWWVSWKRWQMNAKPYFLPMIFVYLWLFNFAGIKKKIQCLLQKMVKTIQDMSYQSHTVSNNFTNWDSWKEFYEKNHQRFIEKEKERSQSSLKN